MECGVNRLAAELVELLQRSGLEFATAESCTGGAVSQAVVQVAGCSAVMKGAVVAYSNSVKSGVLGVSEAVLAAYGAVSEEVVREMVCGVSRLMGCECAVATSGIAGPGGGSAEKPVGTVWVAVKVRERVVTKLLSLNDKGRLANIEATVANVLELVCAMLRQE